MISILFAYLLAGHFVAKQLPKAVAVGMTAVYCLVIAGTLLSHLGSHMMMDLTSILPGSLYPRVKSSAFDISGRAFGVLPDCRFAALFVLCCTTCL
jgi:hypothetical protein